MFWNKKKEKEPEIKVCEVDKNLSECNSILNLRSCQQQLKEIKNTKLNTIIDKYFYNSSRREWNDRMSYYLEHDLHILLSNEESKYKNFEERFKEFGKELDEYFIKDTRIKELQEKIKEEKNKLGIM